MKKKPLGKFVAPDMNDPASILESLAMSGAIWVDIAGYQIGYYQRLISLGVPVRAIRMNKDGTLREIKRRE